MQFLCTHSNVMVCAIAHLSYSWMCFSVLQSQENHLKMAYEQMASLWTELIRAEWEADCWLYHKQRHSTAGRQVCCTHACSYTYVYIICVCALCRHHSIIDLGFVWISEGVQEELDNKHIFTLSFTIINYINRIDSIQNNKILQNTCTTNHVGKMINRMSYNGFALTFYRSDCIK